MAEHSNIEWTDATWNPVTGCTKVSPGCKNCYAEKFAERFRGVPGHPYEQGFDLKLWPERMELPLKWSGNRMIFVNSMSDLFHEKVADDYIERVFATMERASHLLSRLSRHVGFVLAPDIARASFRHIDLTVHPAFRRRGHGRPPKRHRAGDSRRSNFSQDHGLE